MSAFVVGADCISRAVYGLALVGMPRAPGETETAFGRRLLRLNIEAVRQRYSDHDAADDCAADYEYAEPAPIDDCTPAVAAWKALQCLIYQCSEGNIPERELYKTIDSHADKLGARILEKRNTRHARYSEVWDMPECARAPWGE